MQTNINNYNLLKGKVAIITGGGSGIGESCADILADAGAHVIVAGRNRNKIKMVAQRTKGTGIVCDVTDQSQVETLFSEAKKVSGLIDILVNNAGIPGPVAEIADVDIEQWRQCIQVNLFGAMYCMQQAAKIMRVQKSGSIINMSSLMGIQGYPMRTAYCATKFAMIGMTEACARELGSYGVRVNAIMPGAVSGENMDRILAKRAEAENRSIEDIIKENYTDPAALKRWVNPDEVGRAVLFYASDLSSAITGDKMKVDCGRF